MIVSEESVSMTRLPFTCIISKKKVRSVKKSVIDYSW